MLLSFSPTHYAFATGPPETVSFIICAFPINYRQTVDISPSAFLQLMSCIVQNAVESTPDWFARD